MAVIEATELPVIACDADGRLMLANAAARELRELPTDLESLPQDSDPHWFAEDPDRPGSGDPLKLALAGGDPSPQWRLLPSASGERLPALVGVQALHGAEGELLGAVMRILAADQDAPSEEQPRNHAWDLEMLTEASRLLAEVSDPDEAAAIICTVTSGATGAIAMLLWGLADERLVLRHYETGFASDDLSDLTRRAYAGAAQSLRSRRPQSSSWPAIGTAWGRPPRRASTPPRSPSGTSP